MHSFCRAAYVGYTATPFANIFIHEQAATREEGLDLFPAAFIINLAAPSNYVGPAKVFGARDGLRPRRRTPLVSPSDRCSVAGCRRGIRTAMSHSMTGGTSSLLL